MFESKYNKLLTVVLIIVIVAILGLLGFFAFNFFNEQNNTKQAANFVDSYNGDDLIPEDKNNTPTPDSTENQTNPLDEIKEVDSGSIGNVSSTRNRKTYNGFEVAGTIRIPKTDVSYPVLEDLSKSALENSVVLIYGAGLNQVGNSVIIGHNYRNSQFFSNNKKLNAGDKVYIKDNTGSEKAYTIYSKFETTPEDTSFYQRDTNGKAEITLSTCTDDSSARLILLAKED